MKKLFIVFCLASIWLISPALAADPYFPFETDGAAGISSKFQGWHSQFEKNGDYGESFFFLVQTEKNDFLFVLMSITNLGLRTFDSPFEVQFYTADGKRYNFHRENKKDTLAADTEKMNVKIAGARAWGGEDKYHVRIDDNDFALQLDITNTLPPYKFGDGIVEFYKDKSSVWTLGINTPAGRANGVITINGKKHSLKGFAYHDHGWATIKMPSFVRNWNTLRIFTDKYSLVLHDQHLTETFGNSVHQFGMLGVSGKITGFRQFKFDRIKTRPDKSSGYAIPTEMAVSIESGGYKIVGKVTENRFLDSLDILGELSWPIRTAIKAFYSNPFLIRYTGKYELDVTDPDGKTEHISGEGIVEANYY